MATYVYSVGPRNYETFYTETRKVREDFDKLQADRNNQQLFDATVDKYEALITEMFEPDASLSK